MFLYCLGCTKDDRSWQDDKKASSFLDAPAYLSSTIEIKSLVFLGVCLPLPHIASDWLNIAISYGHKFVFVFDNVLWHNTSSKTKTKTSQEYTASASYNFLTCFMEGLNMFLSLHSNIHI